MDCWITKPENECNQWQRGMGNRGNRSLSLSLSLSRISHSDWWELSLPVSPSKTLTPPTFIKFLALSLSLSLSLSLLWENSLFLPPVFEYENIMERNGVKAGANLTYYSNPSLSTFYSFSLYRIITWKCIEHSTGSRWSIKACARVLFLLCNFSIFSPSLSAFPKTTIFGFWFPSPNSLTVSPSSSSFHLGLIQPIRFTEPWHNVLGTMCIMLFSIVSFPLFYSVSFFADKTKPEINSWNKQTHQTVQVNWNVNESHIYRTKKKETDSQRTVIGTT